MSVELGKRLAEFRKRNGFSQEELASKLQVSRQSICNWESGDSSPSIDFVSDMAKIYKVSVDDLINTEKSVEDCYKEETKKSENSYVHVSKKGIFINDRDDGSFVKIDADGINIKDGFKSNEDDEENYDFVNHDGKWKVVYSEKAKNRRIIKKVGDLITGISALLVSAIYVVLGVLNPEFRGTMWPLFFTFLIPGELVKTFGLKKPSHFPIVFICLTTYFFLGTLMPNNSGWHPYWVIMFAIPIYYAIEGSIIQIRKEKKKNSFIEDDIVVETDDDDDDEEEKSED